jgi:DNA-directed RNA polymerase beta' subunit
MTIYLKGEHAKSKEGAVEVARNIIYTSVENLASAIYEDPVREEIIIELNKQMMDDRNITMDEAKRTPRTPKRNRNSHRHNQLKSNLRKQNKSNVCYSRFQASKLKVSQTSNVSSLLRKAVNGSSAPTAQTSAKVLEVEGVDTSRTTTNNIHEIAKTSESKHHEMPSYTKQKAY